MTQAVPWRGKVTSAIPSGGELLETFCKNFQKTSNLLALACEEMLLHTYRNDCHVGLRYYCLSFQAAMIIEWCAYYSCKGD